ncbi:MAG: hypothetical protein NTX32_03650 [Candidatus Firestonebacteria bacterium]|nr:hypothetical protein [Candidatus Firestonebacteria bacterium]
MAVLIKAAESAPEMKEFIDLPWFIYKDNPYWIPNLKSEYRKMLDVNHYPFWQHAKRKLFLAYKDNKLAGRIAAITDDMHNKIHEEKAGFFGYFECINDSEVSKALFDAAKNWLQQQGASYMRGPASPSSNDEYGFLLEGFKFEPAIMMPYNPKYYLKLAEDYGMKKAKDLYALLKSKYTGVPERIEKMMLRAKKNSIFKLRSFDLKHKERDIQIIKDVYNQAWEKNWGFVPMTEAEMDYAAKGMLQFMDPNVVIIAETKEGNKPAGIAITLPNLNEVLKHMNGNDGPVGIAKFLWYKPRIKGCRSLIGGCLKEYRKTGLIAEIFYETAVRANGRYEWCEMSWNLEDNEQINKFDTDIGGFLYKKYRLYQVEI